jgi:hypothetical protein
MSEVLDLKTPEEYRAERPHLFASHESFKWFLHKHRDELVSAGAVLRPASRLLIHAERFDQAVLRIGARKVGSR